MSGLIGPDPHIPHLLLHIPALSTTNPIFIRVSGLVIGGAETGDQNGIQMGSKCPKWCCQCSLVDCAASPQQIGIQWYARTTWNMMFSTGRHQIWRHNATRPPGLVIHRDWCEVDFLPVNCPRTSNDFLVKYLLLVCWDYEIPNIRKNKIHVPNHQPVLHSKAISNQMSAILPKSVSHPLSSHCQTKSTCCLAAKCKKMQKASKSAGCFPSFAKQKPIENCCFSMAETDPTTRHHQFFAEEHHWGWDQRWRRSGDKVRWSMVQVSKLILVSTFLHVESYPKVQGLWNIMKLDMDMNINVWKLIATLPQM